MLTPFITGLLLGALVGHIKRKRPLKAYTIIYPYPLGENYVTTGRVLRIRCG